MISRMTLDRHIERLINLNYQAIAALRHQKYVLLKYLIRFDPSRRSTPHPLSHPSIHL